LKVVASRVGALGYRPQKKKRSNVEGLYVNGWRTLHLMKASFVWGPAFKFKEKNLGVLFIEERQLQSKSLEATIDNFFRNF